MSPPRRKAPSQPAPKRRIELRADPAFRPVGEAPVIVERDPRPRKAKAERQDRSVSARKGGRGWGRRIAVWLAVLGIWASVALAGLLAFFAYDLPDVGKLARIERQPALTLLAADGATTVATYGDLYGESLSAQQLPKVLKQAAIAIEDHRFYSHFGVDLIGTARAVYVNLRENRLVQGGSSITQQLAKNVFLTGERTLKRKIQEVMLALWLERRYSKDDILALYLNRVYFGAGTWGVDAAAQRYFGKSAKALDLAEAAMIAGLVKAPSRYAPTADLARAQSRAAVVLERMAEEGFVAAADAAAAKARPATLAASAQSSRDTRYFADWVADQVDDFVGRGHPDLIVQTTLDPRMQGAAEEALRRVMETEGPKHEASQAALVAMTADGAVKAMVGGLNYRETSFNRATQARRQPGSAFKLFVYLAALEAGMSPDTPFYDGPLSIGGWSPGNYEGKYQGELSMRDAVARSSNTIAVQISEQAGRRNVIEMAHRLGIAAKLPAVPSIALGTSEVTLLELTGAYGAMASGGIGVIPFGISQIRTREGRVLYRREGGGPGRVLSPGVQSQMQDMLAGVVASPFGTGRAARLDRPTFAKTGTTQDFRDAWFVGYSPELVAGVWVGNDNDSPMKKVTGGGLPALVWKDFMAAALRGLAPKAPVVAERVPEPASGGLWQKILREFGGSTPAGPRQPASVEVLPPGPPSSTQ